MQTPVPVGGPPRLPGTSGGPAGPGAMEGMFFDVSYIEEKKTEPFRARF